MVASSDQGYGFVYHRVACAERRGAMTEHDP